MGKRSSWEIKAEILETCLQEPKTFTEILFKVRLLGGYYSKYVRELVEKGMLEVVFGKRYKTTQKGSDWLKLYNQLKQLEG